MTNGAKSEEPARARGRWTLFTFDVKDNFIDIILIFVFIKVLGPTVPPPPQSCLSQHLYL
jgi:hypothetical protein